MAVIFMSWREITPELSCQRKTAKNRESSAHTRWNRRSRLVGPHPPVSDQSSRIPQYRSGCYHQQRRRPEARHEMMADDRRTKMEQSVAHHHQPVLVPVPQLSTVAHLADCVAHFCGSAPGWEAYALRLHEQVASALGLDPQKIETLVIEVREAVSQMDHLRTLV